MTNYDAIKSGLEKYGKLMIRVDTGEKIELHKHNVTFEDQKGEIIIDTGTEIICMPLFYTQFNLATLIN